MKQPSGLDAASKALWRLVVDDLTARGVLRDVDEPAIGRYVVAEQVARLARQRMAARAKRDPDSAYTTRGSMGQLVQHPDLKTAREAERDAASYAADLGVTPRARAVLREQLPAGPDPFAEFVGDELAARRAR
jgi:P27 family predicted phage terminase small subunit